MYPFLTLILFSYLLGSVPFGIIIASAHGKDLRAVGSGNIGATNVARALGRKWAYICFVLDVSKGLVPMLTGYHLVCRTGISTAILWLWLAAGCAAIIGHVFPVYLRFKGGKGVATSLGVVLGLYPYYTIAGIAAFITWAGCVLIWRYISLASIIAAVVFPLALFGAIIINENWHFAALWPLIIIALVMPILVIGRHAENIKRLLEGTELKVFQK